MSAAREQNFYIRNAFLRATNAHVVEYGMHNMFRVIKFRDGVGNSIDGIEKEKLIPKIECHFQAY